MKRIIDFIVKRSVVILLLIVGITVLMFSGIKKLEVKNDWESELPEDDPIVNTKNRIENIFGKKDNVMIGIECEDIFNMGTLDKIIKISEELKQVEGVISDEITSLSTINNIVGNEWGIDVGEYMVTLPETEEEIQKIKREVESNNMIYGQLVSKDFTFTLISANIEAGYDVDKTYEQVKQLADKYSGNEKIFLAGDPIQQKEIDIGIQSDMGMLLPIALLLILFGYFLAFRTLKGILLPFSVVILCIIWTMGSMGFIGFPITVVSSVIPMLMIAIASSYGIHIMQRYYDDRKNFKHKEAVKESTYKISSAIIMTGITSALGSFSLLIFKVKSIREFGLITSFGILFTLILTLTLIPAILSLTKEKKEKISLRNIKVISRFLENIGNFSLRRRKFALLLTLILVPISIIGIMKIRIGTDFIKYFPKEHVLRTTFEKFNDKLGGARYMDIMFKGDDIDKVKDPEFMKTVDDFRQFAELQQGVGKTYSFADILKRINKEMNNGNSAFEKIPESREMIAQYLLLYSMSGDPGDFNDLVDYDYQRTKMRIMLNTSEQEDHLRLYQLFSEYSAANFPEGMSIEFGGEAMFWLSQVRYIVYGKIQNIILAVIIVLLFCIIVYRSFSNGLISIIPLTISSLLTFGVMGFIGIRLETGTAIITAIGIGIGVDFAIHYIVRFRECVRIYNDYQTAIRETMLTSGRAIFYDVLSNVLGFGVFIFSGFKPLQSFGWLISLTMITVALGSLVIIPAFIVTFKVKGFQLNKSIENPKNQEVNSQEKEIETAKSY